MSRAKVEEWEAHVEAAQKEGKSLACYAREHGLACHRLYEAQRKSRQRKAHDGTNKGNTTFIPVQLAAAAAGLRAELPNGVVLHYATASTSEQAQWIAMLAALPCSR